MALRPTPHAGRIVLHGPQTDYAEIRRTLDGLGVDGTVVLITCGWQENETEDEALVARIGRPATNLTLHARSEAFYDADIEYAQAAAVRQRRLRRMQHFYRVRLDAIDDAARSVSVGQVDPELESEQHAITTSQLRHLDQDHILRCQAVWSDFEARWPAREHPELMRHREEIAATLASADALVIAGGHVGTLLNRLRLFDVFAHVPAIPIIAWSAGAMTLADRIVLFHDSPPFGKNLAQLLDFGFGLASGVVVMPDIQNRVAVDDVAGIARFASRMEPDLCMGMDPGTRLVFDNGILVDATADRLMTDGTIQVGWQP